jgi:hypothetical protein
MQKSFLEISDETIAVSAVKRGENGNGWVVRLFNPASGTIKAKLRLNGGQANSSQLRSPVERLQKDMAVSGTGKQQWGTVRIVNLEELAEKELATDGDGWCNIEMPAKKILTLEFLAD